MNKKFSVRLTLADREQLVDLVRRYQGAENLSVR